jgi:hypothetical protein
LFQQGDYRNKVHDPEKSVLDLTLGEDIGFRGILCYQYILNDWACGKLLGNKG